MTTTSPTDTSTPASHGGSRRAVIAALVANLGVAIVKLVGFAITRSAGLLAEAGHSFADTGNQVLLLVGARRAQQPRDKEHPFGYGRERYFWSFVVALVLFSLGGMFAVYEGVDKFIHPHEATSLLVAVGILIFCAVIEGFSLRTAVRESRAVKPVEQSWWRFIRDAKEPELTVVLLEDTGAETGLFIALAGVLVAHITGDARWDAVGSILIGLLLIVIASVLAVEMKGLLIGESASPAVRQQIRNALISSIPVSRVIHLRTEHLGPNELLVCAKCEFDRTLTFVEVADAIDATEQVLRAAVPTAVHIYIEPDIYREPE
ncbi:MAG: cation diffusion facilitator family transporter [Ilumatobacteraceae bacterium]